MSLTGPICCLAQDPQELAGYRATTDQMDSLVSKAQKEKKEQTGKEEKWVIGQFCQLIPLFLSSLTVQMGITGKYCVEAGHFMFCMAC